VLGGDPGSGLAADLPDVATYSFGTVVEIHPRITAAVDVIGRYVIDSPRLRAEDFHALNGTSVFPNIAFESGSFNELNAAAGVKVNLLGRLLLDLNLVVPLNQAGLRDKLSPLIGLEYVF
jgi:hypothetical protein